MGRVLIPSFITGASGFIGSHLAKALTDTGEGVVILMRDIPPGMREGSWLNEALRKCTVAFGDVRNFKVLKRIINQYEINYVFHLASQAIVRHAYKDPINTYDVNVMGTVNILEACRQLDVEKVLVMSTDKVYGDVENASESYPLLPTEPYGTSKSCADLIAQSFIITYGMNILIPRSCNAYGYDLSNRIVPNTVRACLRGQNPIIYQGEESSRQYIFVKDLVGCLIHMMNNANRVIFNIATEDGPITQGDVVLEILKHFPDLKPEYVKREVPKEIKNQSMTVFEPVFEGWRPKFPFEEGIKPTIDAFRKYGF